MRESAPITTPPSKLAAMMVVPIDTACGKGRWAAAPASGEVGRPCLAGIELLGPLVRASSSQQPLSQQRLPALPHLLQVV